MIIYEIYKKKNICVNTDDKKMIEKVSYTDVSVE